MLKKVLCLASSLISEAKISLGVLLLSWFIFGELHSSVLHLAAVDIFTYIVLVLFGVGVGFCIRK